MAPLRIFISSVSGDFDTERELIRAELAPAYEAYLFENDVAHSTSPKERLKKVLAESEAYVGIHGPRFGSKYESDGSNRSIVEWEFDTARELKRRGLFHFVKKPLKNVEPAQEAFLKRLLGFDGSWTKEWSTADQLVSHIFRALAVYVLEKQSVAEGARRRVLRYKVPILATVYFLALLLLVGAITDRFSTVQTAALAFALVAVLTAADIFFSRRIRADAREDR